MNSLDLAIFIVVLVGLVRGFSTGGIRQVLSLAGVVLAFIGAARLATGMGSRLVDMFEVSESLAPVLAFIVVFGVIQGAMFGLARLLEKFLKTLQLGIVNRILGGALGGFKALLVVSLALLMGHFIGIPGQETKNRSMFYSTVYPIMPATWSYVTGRMPSVRRASEAPAGIIEDVPAVPDVESTEPESDAL